MRRNPSFISDLGSFITIKDYNQNIDFINQNYDLDFDYSNNTYQNDEKYVKVKHLKGKR